ncbi:transcriptional regulator family: Fungal Specific TF [Penicillium hetheringtonii]|uniref:Transcriptional regulator family: Fungal Specific TF n=1 Tax=Penicillium hetheringtonii TaxID=911720 RepID=A0AAD6DDG7_9EURO|nr:transcriptional regulator family: Fungal Specific TF [Penicillium hetheringtonii]
MAWMGELETQEYPDKDLSGFDSGSMYKLFYKSSNRIGAAKSRAGCKTCKIRRVKCGEEKPICRRCSSTGRKCEYEGTYPPSYSLVTLPDSGYPERRAFEYYVQHASKGLAAGMNLDFWTKVAPQICRSEPAVWDAVNSISVLYEHPDQCLDLPLVKLQPDKKRSLNQNQREALLWYSRAISSIQSQIVRGRVDPYVALISSVLFICIEAVQGRVTEALQLYEKGVNLIVTLRHQVANGTLPSHRALLLEKTIIPLFLRLGSISLTISTVQVSQIFAFANYDLNTPFVSLDAARTAISVLFSEATLLEREAFPYRSAPIRDLVAGAHLVVKQQSLQTQLDHWLQAYNNLSKNCARAEPMLLAYYAATSIYVCTCLSHQELVYDSYMAEFTSIVENARLALAASGAPNCVQPPFTFEMGLGLPLFLTAIKCRDPHLRRKALGLLRQAPPIQAFFTCAPAASLAEKCMHLEEDYSRSIALTRDPQASYPSPECSISDYSPEPVGELSSLVPEEARICYSNVLRPQNGPSPGAEGGIAEDLHGSNQTLEVFRNHFDEVSNTWRIVSQCVPL